MSFCSAWSLRVRVVVRFNVGDCTDGFPAVVHLSAGDERVVLSVRDEPVDDSVVVNPFRLERLLEKFGRAHLQRDRVAVFERQANGSGRDVVHAFGERVHTRYEDIDRTNRWPFGPRRTIWDMTDTAARADLAERAARAGAAVAEGFFRRDVAVETKANRTDFVTRADRDAQRQVVAAIRDEYEEDAIVGEEADELKEVPAEGPVWVVDPVDGTNNFVRENPVWTTSVAAIRDGEAIAAANACPTLGDVYTADADGTYRNGERVSVSDATDPETFTVIPTLWWNRSRRDEYAAACREIVFRFDDLRRFGSAQIELSMVATGQVDAAITNVTASPWDTVAGAFMVEQAGGVVTGVDGERWTHASDGIVASNGEAHDELLAAARNIDS